MSEPSDPITVTGGIERLDGEQAENYLSRILTPAIVRSKK